MSRRAPDTGVGAGSRVSTPKVRRSSADRRGKGRDEEHRRMYDQERYEIRNPQPSWWSRLSDHERADWLRERARSV